MTTFQEKPHDIDLGKTQITDKIRVSTAAIFREEYFGKYWLIETWIFSDDLRQRSRQIIHGSSSGDTPSPRLCDKAKEVHQHISYNLHQKFAE